MLGTKVGDTAYYDPELRSIVHYRAQRYLMVTFYGDHPAVGATGATGTSGTNGAAGTDPGTAADPFASDPPPSHQGIDEYATGTSGFHGAEGTWRDAEDGHLQGNPIAQGAVDSTISSHVRVGPERREIHLHGPHRRPLARGTARAAPVAGEHGPAGRHRPHHRLLAAVGRRDEHQLRQPPRERGRAVQAVAAGAAHADRQRRRDHRRQRQRHHAVLARHLLLHVAAGRRPGRQRPGPGRLPRRGPLVLPVLRARSSPPRATSCTSTTPTARPPPVGTRGCSRASSRCRSRRTRRPWWSGHCGGTTTATATSNSSARCGWTWCRRRRTSWSATATRAPACRCPATTCGRSAGASTPSRWPRCTAG